jgi:hypothetical protein
LDVQIRTVVRGQRSLGLHPGRDQHTNEPQPPHPCCTAKASDDYVPTGLSRTMKTLHGALRTILSATLPSS